MQGVLCSQRLNKDISELFSSNFNCSASHLTVIQTGDSINEPGFITLENKVFEGPYRGGRFSFFLNIPPNYPFRAVEVWAVQPIWHPNIDMRTGKVVVPIDWSPVLTLHSFALAVQMLMLEPSTDNPLNLEALSMYISHPAQFEHQVQRSLQGGIFHDIYFPNVQMSFQDISVSNARPVPMKRSRQDDVDMRQEDDDMETNDYVASREVSRSKRVCRYRDMHTNASTDEEDNNDHEDNCIEDTVSDGNNSNSNLPSVYASSAESPLFGNSVSNPFASIGLGLNHSLHHNYHPHLSSSSLSTIAANPLINSPRQRNSILHQHHQVYPPHPPPHSAASFAVLDPNNNNIASDCSKLSLRDSKHPLA